MEEMSTLSDVRGESERELFKRCLLLWQVLLLWLSMEHFLRASRKSRYRILAVDSASIHSQIMTSILNVCVHPVTWVLKLLCEASFGPWARGLPTEGQRADFGVRDSF